MNNEDLEKLIDRELKRLPLQSPPPTLVPRVLKAVECQVYRPWYQRSWAAWPPLLRLASAGVMGGMLAGLFFLIPAAQIVLGDVSRSVVRPVADVVVDFRAAFAAANVIHRALSEVLFGYLLVLGIMMGTACAGLCAALARLAVPRGASQ